MDGDIIKLDSTQYPPLLREIPDAPTELYARGNVLLLNDPHNKLLTVVGSRACTAYGTQVVEHLLRGLRGYPVVIVSGLALGMDAHAHRTALAVGLPTIAVPGSGLDDSVIAPRSNFGLARDILTHNGTLLSEYAPDTQAAPWTFPKRNRIMAGMSHATLLVEAGERSGTLITARLTSEYNRELLVVPGSIFSHMHRGVHQFLKLGATPVTEPEDILRALGIEPQTVNMGASSACAHTDLSEQERHVLHILAEPMGRNALVDVLELPITDANVLLSTMELKGLIVEKLGLVHSNA